MSATVPAGGDRGGRGPTPPAVPAARPTAQASRGTPTGAALLAATLALAYVIVAPRSGDLASHLYRADLFGRVGFALWDNGWYAGHPTLAYSTLFPPLGWLLGVRLAGALAVTAAAAAFAALVSDRDRDRDPGGSGGRLAAIWFAIGVAEWLLAGRLPFLLGTALGLTALVAHARAARVAAFTAALAAALASPLAGAFLALAALALAATAAARSPRRAALTLAGCALAPVIGLSVALNEGGSEPFAASSFWPGLASTLALLALLPRERRDLRALRVGVALYAAACLAAFLIPTPVGGNAARLGALFGGPVLVAALWQHPRRRLAVALLALPFAYWQLQAPVRDVATAAGDSSVQASYYRPLLGWLATRPGPFRLEIASTRLHWEAALVAPVFPIARGWERQLDIGLNAIFYRRDHPLSNAEYRRWLLANAIAYVAVPDAPLDYSARAEAALIASRPAYLTPVWSSAHWHVFAVAAATALASPPAALTAISPQSFTLRFAAAGSAVARIRFSRYWAPATGHGCVARAPGGYTLVSVPRAGTVTIAIHFSLARVFAHSRRCA